jgi:rhamnogalacturonyl hydrolase YesR
VEYINRAAREMVAYIDTLQNEDGLFYHAPDVPYYWGRGDGWLAAGMAELLQSLPEDNLYRPKIMNGYLKMMAALLKNQSSSGMWRQLITDPEAWPETSGSAMFTFAFITGVKNGWIPASIYEPAAKKAWIALVGYLDENANLKEICEGTNKKNDHQYYLNRKRIKGDLHGQAPLLWCVDALIK